MASLTQLFLVKLVMCVFSYCLELLIQLLYFVLLLSFVFDNFVDVFQLNYLRDDKNGKVLSEPCRPIA